MILSTKMKTENSIRTGDKAVRTGLRGAPQAGFTLVEILFGMVLLAIIFTSAFGTHFLALRMVEDSRDQVRASQVIQSELEAMRTMNWSDLEALGKGGEFVPRGRFAQVFVGRYTAYRSIVDLTDSMKEVRIWVEWESRGRTYTQTFNTVFTRNGLNDYHYRAV